MRTCILRAFGLQVSRRLSLALVLRLFCFASFFVFICYAVLKPRPCVQSLFALRSSIYSMRPDSRTTHVSSFPLLWRCRFFPVFSYHCYFISVQESTLHTFPFRVVFFYLATTGWIFDNRVLCENSTNQQSNQVPRPALIPCHHYSNCWRVRIFMPNTRVSFFTYPSQRLYCQREARMYLLVRMCGCTA